MSIWVFFFLFFLTLSVYQRCNFHSLNISHSWINALLFLLNSLEVVRQHMSQWLAARRTAEVLQKGGGICGIRSCLCLFEGTFEKLRLLYLVLSRCFRRHIKLRSGKTIKKKSFTFKRHFVLQIRNNVCLDSSSLQ